MENALRQVLKTTLNLNLTLLVPICSIIIIRYIHSSNTSTTFYKVSTGYMFLPSWAIIRPYTCV